MSLEHLAHDLTLADVLSRLSQNHDGYELLAHWQQGEFHHDVVLRLGAPGALPGAIFVVSTNCNGGVKEILVLAEPPTRDALWHYRCPENNEFESDSMPLVLDSLRTVHYFDPSELLAADARSELKPEFRSRQRGGGWVMVDG